MNGSQPKTLAQEAYEQLAHLQPADRDQLRALATRLSGSSVASTGDPQLRTARSLVLGMLGERERAVADAKAALALTRPGDPGHVSNLVGALTQVGLFDEATALARVALTAAPDAIAIVLNNASMAALHAGDAELLNRCASLETETGAFAWLADTIGTKARVATWIEHQKLARAALAGVTCRVGASLDDTEHGVILEYWTTLDRRSREEILRRVSDGMRAFHRSRGEAEMPHLSWLGLLVEQLPTPPIRIIR